MTTAFGTPWALKIVTASGGTSDMFLDEARALGLEVFHHVLVVHDLVAHVDRRAVFLQRALDDLDRAHDAGAKSAGLSKYDAHR